MAARRFNLSKEELERLYWEEGKSIKEIANIHGVHATTIHRWMIKYNIPRRIIETPSDKMKRVKIDKRLIELVDGLLLSDGTLSKPNPKHRHVNSRLRIPQRADRIEWLNWIKGFLIERRIKVNLVTNEERSFTDPRNGKIYVTQPQYLLYTEHLPFFREQYQRWYPNGEKHVPIDINLSPLTLAQWYMGDGSLSFRTGHGRTHAIFFYTYDFTEQECDFLGNKLKEKYGFNIKTYKRSNRKYKGKEIYISGKRDVLRFLEMTRPYMVDCFAYKWWPILK